MLIDSVLPRTFPIFSVTLCIPHEHVVYMTASFQITVSNFATCIGDYCAATLVYRGFIKLCNGMRYNKISANLELPRGASQSEANLRMRLVYNTSPL